MVGADFQFGRDRAGDCEFLIAAGSRHGFEVEVVGLVESNGVISSTRIRRLIEDGDVSDAADLLGNLYRLSNVVSPGDQRGKGLGFPTANLRPPERKVIPGNGIYAAWARFGREILPAAVNVGVRPTFGGHRAAHRGAHHRFRQGDLRIGSDPRVRRKASPRAPVRERRCPRRGDQGRRRAGAPPAEDSSGADLRRVAGP